MTHSSESDKVLVGLVFTDPKAVARAERTIDTIICNLYPGFTDGQKHALHMLVLADGCVLALRALCDSAPEPAQPVLMGVAEQHLRFITEICRAHMMPVPQMQAVFAAREAVMQAAGESMWNQINHQIN